MAALVRNLDHLNMSVASLAESVAWYQRVFGFEIVEHGDYRGRPWQILRSQDALLCLYEDPERCFVDPADLYSRQMHGLNHFAFRISDRAAWEAAVARENLKIRYGGEQRWDRSSSWYVTDPTGYEIEVVRWDDGIAF